MHFRPTFSAPCYIIETLGRLEKKRIKNDKCVHSWLILTFDTAQPESNSVILQIGEGEPASLHVSNIDPSGKANNNGQILWFRGLNRIQQQVTLMILTTEVTTSNLLGHG